LVAGEVDVGEAELAGAVLVVVHGEVGALFVAGADCGVADELWCE